MKNLKLGALALLASIGLVGCTGEKEPEVEVVLSEVKLDLSEVKTDFTLGEEFSSEGLKVVASYSNGTSEDLSFALTETPDMDKAGEGEVTVSYTLNGEESTLTYNINVWYWSKEELSIQSQNSLYPVVSYFPYVMGMKTELVYGEDEEVTGWQITMPNATVDDVDSYAELLVSNCDGEFDLGDELVTFELIEAELPTAAAQHFGVDPETALCYSLIPYYWDVEEYDDQVIDVDYRYFIEDEYIIIGLDDENNLVVTNRMVNAMFESIFGWAVSDGPMGSDGSAYMATLLSSFELAIKSYLGEYFEGGDDFASNLIVPDPALGLYVAPFNLSTNNPFAFSLDEYDLAFAFEAISVSDSWFNDFVSNLLDFGYTASQPDEDGCVTYTHTSESAGTFEVEVYPYQEDLYPLNDGSSAGSFLVYYYFNKPTKPFYKEVTPESAVIDIFLNAYSSEPVLDEDYFYYEEDDVYGTYILWDYSEDESEAEEMLIEDLDKIIYYIENRFLPHGFNMEEEFTLDEENGSYGAFYINEEGTVGLECYIYVDEISQDTTYYCVFIDFYAYYL